jgi:hypothetical protein
MHAGWQDQHHAAVKCGQRAHRGELDLDGTTRATASPFFRPVRSGTGVRDGCTPHFASLHGDDHLPRSRGSRGIRIECVTFRFFFLRFVSMMHEVRCDLEQDGNWELLPNVRPGPLGGSWPRASRSVAVCAAAR